MKEFLILELDAPLLAFGGPMIDNYGVIQEHPALSMITGLIGNALGLDHRETDRLDALQRVLQVAARRDRGGDLLVDYQTVDLGQDHMVGTGWTTLGREMVHGGGSGRGTHIRHRHYRADCLYTCALGLDEDGSEWNLTDIERALRHPARPLFVGRKCCLPSRPLLAARLQAESLRNALERHPRFTGRADAGPLPAWWPVAEPEPSPAVFAVTDRRDWRNQIHVGRRFLERGQVNPPEAAHE